MTERRDGGRSRPRGRTLGRGRRHGRLVEGIGLVEPPAAAPAPPCPARFCAPQAPAPGRPYRSAALRAQRCEGSAIGDDHRRQRLGLGVAGSRRLSFEPPLRIEPERLEVQPSGAAGTALARLNHQGPAAHLAVGNVKRRRSPARPRGCPSQARPPASAAALAPSLPGSALRAASAAAATAPGARPGSVASSKAMLPSPCSADTTARGLRPRPANSMRPFTGPFALAGRGPGTPRARCRCRTCRAPRRRPAPSRCSGRP